MRTFELNENVVAQVTPSKFPTWSYPEFKSCLIKSSKKYDTPQQIRNVFLEHLDEHQSQINVYTDGSKTIDKVGYAVIINDSVIKKRIPSTCTVFTAELSAVLAAVKFIFDICRASEKYVIHTDSQSIILSLKQLYSQNALVIEVQEWLYLLHTRKKCNIVFCWVPAHVGIRGNEDVDAAAKEAAELPSISRIPVPHKDLKGPIHDLVYRDWQDRWSFQIGNKLRAIRPSIKPWSYIGNESRKSDIILTRLRIGHSHLTHSFLLRTGIDREIPLCEPCRCELTISHILVECPTFNNDRTVCCLNGKSLVDILCNNDHNKKVIQFLKRVNIFNKL